MSLTSLLSKRKAFWIDIGTGIRQQMVSKVLLVPLWQQFKRRRNLHQY